MTAPMQARIQVAAGAAFAAFAEAPGDVDTLATFEGPYLVVVARGEDAVNIARALGYEHLPEQADDEDEGA